MSKLKLSLAVVVCIIIALSYCLSVASAANVASSENWLMFRHDLNHTAQTNDTSTLDSAKLLWIYKTSAAVWSSPAVANGRVFVGSKDGYIYCLNSSSGNLLWRCGPAGGEFDSSPAVVDERVYISAYDGYVYCINIDTGQPIWVKSVGGYVFSSPTVVNNQVYVGSGNKDLFCFNATDGSIIWTFSTAQNVDSSPAVSDGVVYFASGDFSVYAVNASTGGEIWHRHDGCAVCSPSVYDGSVYIGSYNGYVFDLNASTGDQIWSYQTQDEVLSCPAVAYGAVYVGSRDNNIYCLNASTGHKIWQTPTGYWVGSSPAVSGSNIYVGSEDYNIYCLNAYTGKVEWKYATGNYVDSSPAIASNSLYVGSFDSRVYAFVLTNSSVQTSMSTTTPIAWTTIAFDGIAYVLGATIVFAALLFVRSKWRNKQNIEAAHAPRLSSAWFLMHAEGLCVLGILAFCVAFFVTLGSGSLWASDEQTYSQMAYSMVKNQDYLTPWASGSLAIWTGKPQFVMWLMALSYQVFGVNNFATRLPSAVLGTLSLIVVFYLGKKLYNLYTGFLSALVLGTFTMFYAFATHAMLDVPLIFFMLVSIYCLLLSENIEKADLYAVLSGIFFGCALLTKQINALLIPLVIFVYFLVTKKSVRFFFTKRFMLFLGVALLIFVPWMVYMNERFGYWFWNCYFTYSDLSRATSSIEGHAGNYLYYFDYMIIHDNPVWLVLLPFSVALCAFNAFIKRLKSDTLVLTWIIVVLAVFTFAQTKIYYYILPAFPAFALAIGNFMYELYGKLRLRRQVSNAKRL